jgi:hypothetical protein
VFELSEVDLSNGATGKGLDDGGRFRRSRQHSRDHPEHYAQWTAQRQERILSLVQDVWDVGFLSDSKKLAVTTDSKGDNLVDGMGFEYVPNTQDQ